MRIVLALAIMYFNVSLLAREANLSHYVRQPRQDLSTIKLVNPNFEQGALGWSMGEGAISRGSGSNGSTGIVIRRTDPTAYALVNQKVIGMLPGRRYSMRVMVRVENVKVGSRVGASCYIEHYDKSGNYMSCTGSYPIGVSGTHGWQELVIDNHMIPTDAGSTNIGLYLGEKTTGTAWFDDVRLMPLDMPMIIYPLGISQNVLPKGDVLRFKLLDGSGTPLDRGLKAHVTFLNHNQVSDIIANEACFPEAAQWEGKGPMTIRIINPQKKLIVGERILPMLLGGKLPHVRFDHLGRTLVDGRLFMPIGLYCNINHRSTLRMFKEIGFNTVMPYNSDRMDLGTWHKGTYNPPKALEGILRVMDFAHQHDMKVIFCMKGIYPWINDWWVPQGRTGTMEDAQDVVRQLATGIRRHPALLAYYTADETSPNYIRDLERHKDLLASLDHDHPVWQVHSLGYNTSTLFPFGGSCDVIGIDYYPFTNPAESSLEKLEGKIRLALDSGLPQWIVPQMFNWRRYRKKDGGKDLKFPNLGEYRSQILLEAGCGMKGFIFYVHAPLCTPDPVLDGDSKAIKAIIRAGNALLKDMEPFIMSDCQPKKIPLKIIGGKVSAWRFQANDGRQRVAVISLKPGKHVAEFTIPVPLKSTWGQTHIKGRTCRFEAENINCDLLQ